MLNPHCLEPCGRCSEDQWDNIIHFKIYLLERGNLMNNDKGQDQR